MNENPRNARYNARDFVDRELAAGKKVILLGHPDPTVAGGSMPDYYTSFMNEYASWASKDSNIFFIDPRTWTQFSSMELYFADDESHPGPLMGTKQGEFVASLISAESGGISEDSN